MHIHEIDTTNRREANRFINLPFDLYGDSPYWVPPFMSDARFQLDREKNPYYRENDAAFFLAVEDGQDVGRIAALWPRRENEYKGGNEARFFLFDAVDDPAVANALFDAVSAWARERGLDLLRGPLGFLPFDGIGMLAKGFEHRPAVTIPYNYEYYNGLTTGYGFELEERVYSGYLSVPYMLENFPQRVLDIADKVRQRYGFEERMFTSKRALLKWAAPRLVEVYNRSFGDIAGDPPVPDGAIEALADKMLTISDPRLLRFLTKDDDIIGFLFCFIDIAEGLRKSKGRLFPFGWFHLLRSLRTSDWLNLNGMGIQPEYQGMGGTAVMYAELYRALADFPRFKHADVVQISEFNPKSLNEMKKFGVDFYKTHHIYRKAL
jgi:hypothetical protein